MSAPPKSLLEYVRNSDAREDKHAELVKHVLDLQQTLDALTQRVAGVATENRRLKEQNITLTGTIETLMASSTMFQLPPSPSDAT